MKDMLARHKWWNMPLLNETQNKYRRFVRTPGGELPDMLGKMSTRMDAGLKNALKSRFTQEG